MASVSLTTLLDPGTGELEAERSVDPGARTSGAAASGEENPEHGSLTDSIRRSLARPTTWVVVAAMAVGGAIRADVPRGIWLDEAISVHDAHLGYHQMIHTLAFTDVHPPLYFTLLWGWVRVAGYGDIAIRVPSIVLGVLLIPMVFLLGKEAYDRRTGAVAAVLASVAPLLVWYSQEARMYMLLMVVGVVALWAQLRILHRGGWYPWVVYTVASMGLVWTQYFGIWQLLFQQLVFLGVIAYRWRRHQPLRRLLLGWGISLAAIAATMVPLALLIHQQFSVHQATGQAFGVNSGGHLGIYSVIANLAWGTVGYHSDPDMAILVALWPIGMLIALGALGRRPKPVTFLFMAAVLFPLTGMFLLGLAKSNLFEIRYMSTIVCVLFLLTARAITGVATSRRAVTVATGAVVVVMLIGLFDQQFSSSNPRRYNFREALATVDSQARPGDVILYRPVDLWSVVRYYSPQVARAPLSAQPVLPTAGHRVFIVSSPTLMDGTTDNRTLRSAMADLKDHRKLEEHLYFPNVQVEVYQ
jgi:4-amino-4-deoxy-L-arabinose transferase-like glycosyltransferase